MSYQGFRCGVLPLYGDAVGVHYSPSCLGFQTIEAQSKGTNNNWYRVSLHIQLSGKIQVFIHFSLIYSEISTINGSSLKLVDTFTYLGSSVSSTDTDINTRLTKALTAIDRLSVIWKSDLTDQIKRSFFQTAVV